MQLMSSKENLLMWLTLNKTQIFFNNIESEIRIQRILEASKDRWVGVEEFPKPVHLRLRPQTMIVGVAHLIDYGRHKFSLLSQNIREGWVNRRVGKEDIVVAVVIDTRTISTIPIVSRTQHHPVNKQNS
jgi:hypothetical protein